MTGQKFNRLTILSLYHKRKGLWLCRCDCGVEKIVNRSHMINGAIKSCGCWRSEVNQTRYENLLGFISGKLLAFKYIPQYKHDKKAYWLCKCLCGKEIIVAAPSLKNFATRSCGKCLLGEESADLQYVRTSAEYKNWRKQVLKRDNYQCVNCGFKGKIHTHHIIPLKEIRIFYNLKVWNDYKNCQILWDINNGVCLCKDCHYQAHKAEDSKLAKYLNTLS